MPSCRLTTAVFRRPNINAHPRISPRTAKYIEQTTNDIHPTVRNLKQQNGRGKAWSNQQNGWHVVQDTHEPVVRSRLNCSTSYEPKALLNRLPKSLNLKVLLWGATGKQYAAAASWNIVVVAENTRFIFLIHRAACFSNAPIRDIEKTSNSTTQTLLEPGRRMGERRHSDPSTTGN